MARNIANLEAQHEISQSHMFEALGFGSLPWDQGLK
ncbi:MAG: hypothetical protein CMP82_07165 [Gammaproteobacteria bacterium]|nr:hypothetical protein [Gammaproteobacteria bacterium]